MLGRDGRRVRAPGAPVSGARVAALYRRACEHLALARARSYPAYIVDRLERVTADAHQLIYHRREFGLARVRHDRRRRLSVAPSGRMRRYVAVAAATFLLPTIVDRPSGVLAAGVDPLGRQPRDGRIVRGDVLAVRRFDRPDAHGDDRLDDVRLLHPQQRRRRVPVLRRRTVCRPRDAVLPRLQRRVRRRPRRIPDRTRPVVARSIHSSRRTRRSS